MEFLTPRRTLPWVVPAVWAVCLLLGTVVVGPPGLAGALVGGVVVVVFFASTPAILGPAVTADPRMSLVLAVVFFVTKVVALFALFLVLRRAADGGEALDAETVSLTVVATTLAWLGARLWDTLHERAPLYDLPESDVDEKPSGD